MTSTNIKPEEYVMPFGKFIHMRAVDIAEMYKVNPKTGQDEPVGLKYLKWLCAPEQSWFKHTNIIEQIIKQAEGCMSEPEGEPIKKTPKKKDVFHKKDDPKPKPENKTMTKGVNPFVLSSDEE